VAACGDGWYGFNLESVQDVLERSTFLRTCYREVGRDLDQLRCAVALRDPAPKDVTALTDLGLDELVLVDSPPNDPHLAHDWVEALAARWLT
jgi:hypothetical protein